ncbi:MAG: YqgE/AlgH family protein [Muribaculaceae bacterium]|jgi:putative transcriptional regulator|uniref:YqgE/AlgH family protein n=1 Tax=Barnesiella sp. CU968 TaxID=2780099 RepID=UPI000E89F7C3|nr:YqgE/AlgH family protein [Barnesiella sp. CU968]MBJ2192340.1 YqgE/AlgH family protein [Muribaculaceae bacterium]ROS84996.1 YqgE/AlgH family protein [Muribaculaceae bacterium Isolate-036 (Harlan)]RXE68365.1 YqgE/AlgH family protein [Muribaculaceae bacterium Isolate-001 (NCI)]HBY17407.1 YqgE/AlgH family protein [Porphyromonadaceae bacterium]MBJ2196931.1 YqgE/AlgH family protein [Muribaculaceae bacterium]
MDLESIIYKDPTIVNPQKGDLLIAEPLLDEPYFKRSVILLLDEDNNQGHIGLALNKITPVSLQDLFPDWKAGAEVPVYSGGPVEADRLFMLHTMGDRFEGSMEVSPGLYVGAKLDDIIDYINNNRYADGNIRFFLGYSGWSRGQLTSEILKNTWALNPNPGHTDVLTGAEDLYWRREVRRLGEKYRSWLLVPSNPAFN